MKKLLALLSAATLCVPAFAVAACTNDNDVKKPDNKPATSINLIEGWEVNADEDSQYTLSPQKDGSLKVSYEKTGSAWQYFKHLISGYEEADLKNMNTLVLESVYNECSTGNNEVTLKFEYMSGYEAQEIKFFMDTTTTKTYEWDVSELNLDKALRLLVFFDGESTQGSGEVTFKKFELSNAKVNAANKIVPRPNDTVEAETAKLSQITETDHKITGWYGATHSRLGKVYDVKEEDNKFIVTKLVDLGTAWTPLCADVKGEELKKMKSFKLVVNGGAGLQIKVEGPGLLIAEEVGSLPATGRTDIICALDNPAALDAETTYTVKIFFNWDAKQAAGTKGSFEIINEYTEFSANPAPVKYTVNTITESNTTANAAWYDNGDEVYTATKDGAKWVIGYDKGNFEWSAVKAVVVGEALSTMKTVKLTVKGTAGKSILFKPFDNNETRIEFTGEVQEIVVDITNLVTDASRDLTKNQSMIIMAEGGVKEVTGSFEILGLEFSTQPKA